MVVLIFVPTKKRKPKAVVAKYGLSTNLIFYKYMKNLELELSGVQSLNSKELKTVEGGNIIDSIVDAVIDWAIGRLTGDIMPQA